ncbi:MAG: hypothetical protein IKD89_07740 [Clostridia bacterium]|nr:hypothetical protein [Clostridia bacterium]
MEILDGVKTKLGALGYVPGGDEAALIAFFIGEAESRLLSRLNRESVPEGLYHVWADMAAGLFLKHKMLSDELLSAEGASGEIKSITEGDVTVAFYASKDGSPRDRLMRLADELIRPDESVIGAYGRLSW